MRGTGERGLTLVELIISMAIMSMLTVAAAALLSVCLQAHAYGTNRSALYREGLLAMERMTVGVRNTTFLLIPNAHNTTRNILAFSGGVNEDNDFYFGAPLFPRVDEDLPGDMTDVWIPGLKGWDDDGDGVIDETSEDQDDDEDGTTDEDPIDGLDNDGDGNIDEDCLENNYASIGGSGIAGIDDDGDGQVDEGLWADNDEDGARTEDPLNPIIYSFDPATSALSEILYAGWDLSPTIVLSTQVTQFAVVYEPPDATHDPRISITLTLTGNDGESITFSEYVYPRNIIQKTGKKVR